MPSSPVPPNLRAFVAESPVHRRAIAAEVQAAAAATPTGARVLDAGAGNAPYRPLFEHCDYVTHDWSASPHESARRADVLSDITSLPLADAELDLVLCTEVLEHVAEPAAALAELARVLRPGGRVVLTVPFVMELHEEPYDFYRYTPHGLRHLLISAGLTDVEVRPLTGWYSTLSHVLRQCALATRDPTAPRRRTYLASLLMLVLSDLVRRAAGRLDGLDERRALPIGWVATARRSSA